MAMISLRQVWINLLSTGEAVHAYSSDRGRSREQQGDVRQYASGRFRPVSVEGVRGQVVFKLRDVTETDIETLESWFGEPVCVRDYRGRVFFGVYFGFAEDERKDKTLYDLSLALHQITYTLGA